MKNAIAKLVAENPSSGVEEGDSKEDDDSEEENTVRVKCLSFVDARF